MSKVPTPFIITNLKLFTNRCRRAQSSTKNYNYEKVFTLFVSAADQCQWLGP